MGRLSKGPSIPISKPSNHPLSAGRQGGHPVTDHASGSPAMRSPQPRIPGMQTGGSMGQNNSGPVTNNGNGSDVSGTGTGTSY